MAVFCFLFFFFLYLYIFLDLSKIIKIKYVTMEFFIVYFSLWSGGGGREEERFCFTTLKIHVSRVRKFKNKLARLTATNSSRNTKSKFVTEFCDRDMQIEKNIRAAYNRREKRTPLNERQGY